ncbi:MAG: right-handed parallel beta-helix repeat-containing protein [Thermoguttaceae bacterium]|nr:right-handed parallel beta-helix repeat-containing protein [Thermoguttaceae bacterium]
MQHIVVEVFGKKKNVTVDQLRDLVEKNYVAIDSPLTINGAACVISDVRDQLTSGASTLTPPGAVSPLVDPFAEDDNVKFPSPQTSPKESPKSDAKNEKAPSRSKSKNLKITLVSAGVALLILVSAFAMSRKQETSDSQTRSLDRPKQGTTDKSVNGKTNDADSWSFDVEKYIGQKTDQNNQDDSSKSTSGPQTTKDKENEENPDFFKAKSVFNVNWDEEDEEEIETEPTYQSNPALPKQSVEEPTSAAPLLVVDHDKIFAEFFSNDARKDKTPSTVTINSPKQLEQALAKLEGKSRTVVLKPNSAPYELKKTATIEGTITIKGESDDPADATILVVPESTPRSGALAVSGGKLTLEGVTIKRNAPCSEEFALVSVDAKGEANVTNCVFDASDAKGGRGVYVNGIGSSATLESTTFKGFDDGVYAFNSSTSTVANGCAFEENARGATVANGAELNVSDSSFTRNGVGVQAKTDGTGSLAKCAFENNDVPCEVDSYSENKFKRTNNIGLD